MAQAVLDELSRIDEAFAGNLLLATFPAPVRALIEPAAEVVSLELHQAVLRPGQDVRHTLFPFGSTTISMLVIIDGDRTVEVGSIGREGALGGIVSCGNAPAFTKAVVQVPGQALRVPMAALDEAKDRSKFLQNLFCRYSDYLLAQVMQSVACNAFHSIQQRAARWLLTAQDRAGDRLELTQEALAGLLGVQRTSVNAAVRMLQEDGLVETRRGGMRVLDRAGLKRRACECYAALERHFGEVIGPGGAGAGAGR